MNGRSPAGQRVAGNYVATGNNSGQALPSGTAATTFYDLLDLDPADYAVTGLTAKLRLRLRLRYSGRGHCGTTRIELWDRQAVKRWIAEQGT